MTRRTAWLGGGALLIAVAVFSFAGRGATPDVPTAVAERGTFVDAVQVRGEIKAGRSVTIVAPPDAGELRIVKLAPSGTVVKKGDTLIDFDGTTVARTVEEKRSEVRGFEAQSSRPARSRVRRKRKARRPRPRRTTTSIAPNSTTRPGKSSRGSKASSAD